MELTKKATILFPPDLYDQLTLVAKRRKTSVGDLVREACRSRYALSSREDRLAVVDRMAALKLPVGTPAEMKLESVPALKPLP